MKNINIGLQRSDKVLEQHNLTELIVLLNKKANEFYKNVEGENLIK